MQFLVQGVKKMLNLYNEHNQKYKLFLYVFVHIPETLIL